MHQSGAAKVVSEFLPQRTLVPHRDAAGEASIRLGQTIFQSGEIGLFDAEQCAAYTPRRDLHTLGFCMRHFKCDTMRGEIMRVIKHSSAASFEGFGTAQNTADAHGVTV